MTRTQRAEARNAIDLLMDDHKRVNKLFDDFEDVDREDMEAVQELVETACIELQIHSILEEEIFYPAVRSQLDDDDQENDDLLNEAQVEHESADELIAKLQELEPDDSMYAACFTVLSEYVKHHVKEEETRLFPKAREMNLDLKQLGEDMRLRREELFAEMEADDSDSDLEATAEETSNVSADADEESEDEQERIDAPRTRH